MADIGINLKIAGEQVVIGALRSIGGGLVNLASNALGAATDAFVDFAKESFSGAIEAQKGIDELGASIAHLGDRSPITIDKAMELAESFKSLVGGSDDVVLAMTNVGLRFNSISGDMMPRFIESSADLAVALGIDPVKAAQTLGKVLEDIGTDGAGSIGKLTAAGVQLSDAQKEQILKMVELGDVAGAQKLVLDSLAETTGGKAAAAAETLAGRMAIFQETIADAGEGVALALLPPLTELAKVVLPVVIEWVGMFADILGDLIETLTGQTDPTEKFLSLWESVSEAFGPEVADVVVGFVETFTTAMSGIGDAVSWVIGFLAGGGSLQDAFLGLKDFSWEDLFGPEVGAIITTTMGVLAGFTAFVTDTLIPGFESAVKWVQDNWPAIQKAIADGWAAAQPILQAIWDFIQTVVIPGFQAAVQWVVTNWPMIQAKIAEVWAQAQPILQAAWNFLQTVVIPGFQSVVDWIVVNWPTIYATIQTIMTNVQTVINTILSAIQAFWDTWGTTIMQIVDLSFAQIKTIFEIFSAAFSGDWTLFGEKLREGFDRIWAAITLIVQNAVAWFLTQDWGAIGMDIISGIQGGVTDAAGALANAVVAAARAAYDAAVGFLDAHSPSRLFKGVGKTISTGMAVGILDNISQPVGAVRSMVTGMTSAVTNNSGGNTYNYYGVQANMQYAYNRAVAGAF